MKILFPLLLGTLVLSQLTAAPAQTESPQTVEHKVNDFDPSDGLELAEGFLKDGKYIDAGKLAQRVLQSDPKNQRAHLVLGKAYFGVGALDLAQKQADTLLSLDSSIPEYHLLNGMVKMFSEDYDSAIAELNKAAELSKLPAEQASILNTLVLAYHRSGQPELALKTCVKAVEDHPEEPQLFLSCSRLYREKEDFKTALAVAQAGLEKHPEFASLYASVALAEKGLGHEEESEKAFQALKERDPGLAEALREVLDGKKSDKADYQVWVE